MGTLTDQSVPTPLSPTTRRRSIQWKEDICSYHTKGAILDVVDSTGDIWYQHAELVYVKRKAQAVAREAIRYGFGTLLSNTYGRASEDVQESLNTWSRSGQSRRGLERWINNEYSAKRSDIKRRTIHSVLRAQAKMKEEGLKDADYSMKVLSRLSEAFSIDSKSFARYMGVADELALVYEDENKIMNGSGQDKLEHARVSKEATERAAERRQASTARLPCRPARNLGEASSRGSSRSLGRMNSTRSLVTQDEPFRHFY